MIVSLLVAIAKNNAIGKDNQLLWRLPNDMKYFKDLTWGGVVVMGRKTYESLGKPLPGRVNIVISGQKNFTADGVEIAHSLEDALAIAKKTNNKEVFVIGGGEIYKQSMPLAEKMYITRVHKSFEADTFFPAFNEDEWALKSNLDFFKDDRHKYNYSFQIWER